MELLCNIFTEDSETCTRIEFEEIVETTNIEVDSVLLGYLGDAIWVQKFSNK